MITINITYRGRSADYQAAMDPSVNDDAIRRVCEEAVRGGEVPGVPRSVPVGAFADHVIDRFNGTGSRVIVRPQVPFG